MRVGAYPAYSLFPIYTLHAGVGLVVDAGVRLVVDAGIGLVKPPIFVKHD